MIEDVHITIADNSRSSVKIARSVAKQSRRWSYVAITALATVILSSCDQQRFAVIDAETEDRLRKASESIGEPSSVPTIKQAESRYAGVNFTPDSPGLNEPPTDNPPPETLKYEARKRAVIDADKTIREVTAVVEPLANAEHFTLAKSVQYGINKSLEYRIAEEQYLLIALDLLIQQHLWTPRFIDTITPRVQGLGINGAQSTALQLVNDFSVRQKLPYGGEISATILAQASEQLNDAIQTGQASSLDIALNLQIPLLRGAGLVAQEPLIQAKRNMIYGARAFEEFRR